MKRAAVFFFTERGAETARVIAECIKDSFEAELHGSKKQVEQLFAKMDALIFVGACGIAVRAIAPYIKSKTTDPAVVVADECGQHVISLLSGHIGGANELARRIAKGIGGAAVITTATDVNDRFAVDEWAARNNVVIGDMGLAKAFAVQILRRDLPVETDFDVCGGYPKGLRRGDRGDMGLLISYRDGSPFDQTLRLIPRILHLGIGCKRNTPADRIEAAVEVVLKGIQHQALVSAASIDVKRDEQGLLDYCAAANLPVKFYGADVLNGLSGDFSASPFVRSTVGVDNVCERAAMASAGEGAKLIVRKTCLDGVTVAVAQEKWSVCFE